MLKFRQMIERRVVRRVVSRLLDAGYLIEVDDPDVGPENKPTLHETLKDVVPHLFLMDDDRIWVHEKTYRSAIGWVYFVYGNDGWDVINDYTTNLEDVMKPVNDHADKLEELFG